MDSMQYYFEYLCQTYCGIPQITLEGSVEDWKDLKDRINNLSTFDEEDKIGMFALKRSCWIL